MLYRQKLAPRAAVQCCVRFINGTNVWKQKYLFWDSPTALMKKISN